MSLEKAAPVSGGRVIVVGNEKGGSGKSTVAMHLAIALMKSKQRVATIDLDSRQKTFTNYIVNRHAWGQQTQRDLEIPTISISLRILIILLRRMKLRTARHLLSGLRPSHATTTMSS